MTHDTAVAMIENRVFDELFVGETASLTRTISRNDIDLFAVISGDVNPAHMDAAYAQTDMFHKVIAHGMLGAGLISAVLGTQLPGPGTIYLGQDLKFLAPVGIGDRVTAEVSVVEKDPEKKNVILDCRCVNQEGKLVIVGKAKVRAPTEKVRVARTAVPDVNLMRHARFRDLLERAAGAPALPTAVVHPCDTTSLVAAQEAAEENLIIPILVGPRAKIARVASEAGVDITRFELVDVPHSHAAVDAALEMIRSGKAELLMKGSLHTDELLHGVVAKESGLRTGRRLSHVYLMDVPTYPRPLLLTDAAVNIAPDLLDKRDIVQNAIDLAHVMGIETPRVAILSAVETVNPKLASTVDAAALCKMADRKQIVGGIVDGPLAFDNAINLQAAHDKGIDSPVAGQADILVVPDLEAGNMLAKQLTFLAGADAAGIVLGARVPIILTSRADDARTRLASCAVAALVAQDRATRGEAKVSA